MQNIWVQLISIFLPLYVGDTEDLSKTITMIT